MSILIPVDWHADRAPADDLAARWCAQVPAQIAAQHPPEVLYVDWRQSRRETNDDALVAEFAPKELRRARISGADVGMLLESAASFWRAAARALDRQPDVEALLLWNCGNVDQNLWCKLARERGLPIMHVEHGWLPHTLIYDPVGGYVVGRSEWDELCGRPAAASLGAEVIARWRAAGLSKHAQGGEPPEVVREFCGRGPALLAAMQLEADGSVVYQQTAFDGQRDFLRKCLTWPGPVLVKEHPQAARIEWDASFGRLRDHCRLEVGAKGGMYLGANEDLHALLPMVAAVAAMNSNVLLEAAMAGKPAFAFGKGPHSQSGFTLDMDASTPWPMIIEQNKKQHRAVCEHAARMVEHLTPDGAWLPDWNPAGFWGGDLWADAPARLVGAWNRLLAR